MGVNTDESGRVQHEPTTSFRSWEELKSSGLLWLINRVVFHPRGFALGLVRRDGEFIGWRLLGDGREVWTMPDEDEEFERARRTLTLENSDANAPGEEDLRAENERLHLEVRGLNGQVEGLMRSLAGLRSRLADKS